MDGIDREDDQTAALLVALRAARRGDLSVRLRGDGELAREWNALMAELSGQFRGLTESAQAVARGDLSRRIAVAPDGVARELGETVNAMIERLEVFRAEVARVSERLDVEGKLSAPVGTDLEGLWREFRANVGLAEQIAAVSRYKSEFLANMSHELRTPLNSLLILARLLADNGEGNLSPRQVEYARTIHGAGLDLLGLIDEVLDLSKIEAGKMRVEIAEVDLAVAIDAIERIFRPIAGQRGLELRIERAPGLPFAIATDARRLQQVLRNLLANACKFTEAGSVTLRLARDGERITFAVSDTGIGIAPGHLERIFEPFQQADGSTSRRYGGTGLGLSISRGFAQLLGGSLEVRSEPGRGSTFTLTLPVGITTAAPSRSKGAAWLAPVAGAGTVEEAPALAGRRVLLVDDDVRNIFALASVLEAQRMEVVFAEGGRQALELLSQGAAVDLVLLDIMMPEVDGLEVLRTVRRDPARASLPIVAVTARVLPEDRQRCVEAGASEFLPKPIETPRLLRVLSGLLLGRPSMPTG